MEKFKCPECGCDTFLFIDSTYSTASIINNELVIKHGTTSRVVAGMECNNCGKNVVNSLENVSINRQNLNNVLEMLHEFRNWNKEWDNHFSKHPENVDEFAESLSIRYSVIRI